MRFDKVRTARVSSVALSLLGYPYHWAMIYERRSPYVMCAYGRSGHHHGGGGGAPRGPPSRGCRPPEIDIRPRASAHGLPASRAHTNPYTLTPENPPQPAPPQLDAHASSGASWRPQLPPARPTPRPRETFEINLLRVSSGHHTGAGHSLSSEIAPEVDVPLLRARRIGVVDAVPSRQQLVDVSRPMPFRAFLLGRRRALRICVVRRIRRS